MGLAHKSKPWSKQPSKQWKQSEKLEDESGSYNTDTVPPRTRKKQNDVKDKGRTFKRILEELSLLCEHFVPALVVESV